MALCVLHHKLFDLGAFTLDASGRLLVSDQANGTAGLEESLMRHHGGRVRPTQRPEWRPDEVFLSWHGREVFKGGGSAPTRRPRRYRGTIQRVIAMRRPDTWTPTAQDRTNLLGFEGYGPDDPDIIFVGKEEYCPEDRDQQRDGIWIRCTDPAFAGVRADRKKAHLALAGPGHPTVPVWDIMAAIMAGLTGRTWGEEMESLGSRPSTGPVSSWLTELRPLPRHPSGRFRDTYIADWFRHEFPKAADYRRESLKITGPRILAALRREPAPRFAFFYGLDAAKWAEKQLAPLLERSFTGSVVDIGPDDLCVIGRMTGGTLIVLSGFYGGRHKVTALEMDEVDALISDLSTWRTTPIIR